MNYFLYISIIVGFVSSFKHFNIKQAFFGSQLNSYEKYSNLYMSRPLEPNKIASVTDIRRVNKINTYNIQPYNNEWARYGLVIFVIDSSMPRGSKRIEAVQRAVVSIVPQGKVSVISCFEGKAEVVLRPTSSVVECNRELSDLTKSIMGNLGEGLKKAMIIADEALTTKIASRVTVAVLTDGKAHGILSSSSAGCDWKDQCDVELYEAASQVKEKSNKLKEAGYSVNTVLIDTEHLSDSSLTPTVSEVSEGFATVSGSKFYHVPSLNDDSLLEILSEVHSSV
eukprot:gene5297-7359_t